MDEALTLTLLPHEIIMHISACLLANHDMASSHSLSSTCREMNLVLLPINRLSVMQQHRIRWEPQHLDIDVVLRYREMSAASTSDPGWRRSYGPPLNPTNGRSIWEVRIDRSRSNDGFMLMGVSLQHRNGSCEWCLCPRDGRLLRRSWDRDGNVLCGEPPPEGYPNCHSKRVLADSETGALTCLRGRAQGSVIELAYDHQDGTLTFRLNGGPQGPKIGAFPRTATMTRTPPAPHEIEAGDEGTRYGVGSSPREQTATNQQLLLRPVVGFRIGAGPNDEHDDQVTIRGSSHLQTWGRSREDDGIGARRSIVAAKALRQALDATHASNRMRLASFRLVTR